MNNFLYEADNLENGLTWVASYYLGGEELDDEDAMKAVVQSPEQLADLGKGVCTDFVEYTRAKLDERNI